MALVYFINLHNLITQRVARGLIVIHVDSGPRKVPSGTSLSRLSVRLSLRLRVFRVHANYAANWSK